MSRYCKVKNCSSNDSNAEISFHKIPLNCSTEWLTVIEREVSDIKKSSRICNKHFSPADFKNGRLKKGAVPNQNPIVTSLSAGKLFIIHVENIRFSSPESLYTGCARYS